MSDYILNTEDEDNRDELYSVDNIELTDDEKLVMEKMQELSQLCSEKKIPAFLSAKLSNSEDPLAAWYFDEDPQKAHAVFINEFAALFLHITSKMTMTTITAKNPKTDQVVYEVHPDKAVENES